MEQYITYYKQFRFTITTGADGDVTIKAYNMLNKLFFSTTVKLQVLPGAKVLADALGNKDKHWQIRIDCNTVPTGTSAIRMTVFNPYCRNEVIDLFPMVLNNVNELVLMEEIEILKEQNKKLEQALVELDKKYIPSTQYVALKNGVTLKRSGNVVQLYRENVKCDKATLCSIPLEYRPSIDQHQLLYSWKTIDEDYEWCKVVVQTNGEVAVYGNTNMDGLNMNITYIIQ